MKPLFCVDITENKNNDHLNGCQDGILVQTPSDMLKRSLDRAVEQAQATANRAQLPLLLRVVWGVCGLAALMMALIVLKSVQSISFAQVMRNAGWLVIAAVVCAAVWAVLTVLSRRKEKAVLSSEEGVRSFSKLETAQKVIFDELGVPEDAAKADVLVFRYKVKDGQIKPREQGMDSTPYMLTWLRLFADQENLYLADMNGKYAFPRSALRIIRTVKKHIRFSGWNRDDRPESKWYKMYKLWTDQQGCVHCRWYHILEIALDGETWGIYFPPYERPAFEKAAGVKVE